MDAAPALTAELLERVGRVSAIRPDVVAPARARLRAGVFPPAEELAAAVLAVSVFGHWGG